MKLVFEYSQADGAIDTLAAKAAFEAVLSKAGTKCEYDKLRGQTVMRSDGKNVELKDFRIQNTIVNASLSFELDGPVAYKGAIEGED